MKGYILDLCSGSKSMSSFNKDLKYVSLDIEKKYEPDILTDILKWDYKEYFKKNGFPLFIWFSPPCNEYSILNYSRPNKIPNIKYANSLVEKGKEIINYAKCFFVIENPATGTLKNQGILDFVPFTIVDYCRYGFSYKKSTILFNNLNYEGKTCLKDKCEFVKNGRHEYSIGNSTYKTNVKETGDKKTRLEQRYAVPKKLLEEINEVFINLLS